MSVQNPDSIDLQFFPEFKQAYELCAACSIVKILSEHPKFIDYVDRRARQKIGSPEGDFKAEAFFPALKKVVQQYTSDLEAGRAPQYRTDDGKPVNIKMVKEFRELKNRAGDKTTDYLTWTLAKLREILIVRGSVVKIGRE